MLGTVAIILPEVASLVVVTFVGWMLILTGVAELYLAFQVHGGWRIAGALLTGALSLFAGFYLLAFPLAGVVTLTLFMAAYFVATGVIKAIAAFQLRPVPRLGLGAVQRRLLDRAGPPGLLRAGRARPPGRWA